MFNALGEGRELTVQLPAGVIVRLVEQGSFDRWLKTMMLVFKRRRLGPPDRQARDVLEALLAGVPRKAVVRRDREQLLRVFTEIRHSIYVQSPLGELHRRNHFERRNV